MKIQIPLIRIKIHRCGNDKLKASQKKKNTKIDLPISLVI